MILGATGFVGRHLGAALRARGDEVTGASLRDPQTAARASAGCDAIVNLAGSPIAVRWTDKREDAMWTSRVDAPRAYLAALANEERRPATYVSASAVGYYGISRTETFTEESPPGVDFLARLCAAWEAEADTAATLGMRTAKIRTGLVLAPDGGVLARLLPPFRLGLGGAVASGEQWYSWIHLADHLGIILHALNGAGGVLNSTAPNPVRNREFTRALGAALRRPTLFPVPAVAASLLLGEGAYVITEGQRVLPGATEASGYRFRHPELTAALRDLLGR
ncbi:MAG TPA: TIGR01777 family oxidoreductase [Candidatus Elarobacter sp.]